MSEITAHNRPVTVEKAYDDVARVRWGDTGTLGYVVREAIEQ